MKKLHYLFPALLVLDIFLLAMLVRQQATSSATTSKFQRLHKGMTESEVEAVMGRPGDFRLNSTMAHTTVWLNEDGAVAIDFSDMCFPDKNGRWVDVGAWEGELQVGESIRLELAEKPRRVHWLLRWLGLG